MSAWASILSIIAKLITPLKDFLIWIMARKYERSKIEAEQAKKDAELNAGYAEDLARRPEPGESTDSMRRGDWPT